MGKNKENKKQKKLKTAEAAETTESVKTEAPKKKKRRRRLGDRPDGYKLRTINPMNKFMPYVMPMRCDACNTYADMFDVTKTDKYCREQVKAGKTNFSFLHVMLAAYVRTVALRPAINRFVSGQKIYHRHNIEVVMTIKKTMSIDSPDTCIKVVFDPSDTIEDVYEKFNKVVMEVTSKPEEESNFDSVNKVLSLIPGLLCRWTVKFLNFLDYFGLLPKKLLWVSPFHGSMIITSMGSLGIRPIYHHIYNFGNLPVFLAYGGRRSVVSCDRDGKVSTKKYIEIKAVTDERICDGYYYASAFKLVKRLVENPELLEEKPEEVFEDID